MMVNLLANNGYIVLNKTLMKKVGLYEAILLGELSAEYVYWKKRNELQDDYFYSTRYDWCKEKQTLYESSEYEIRDFPSYYYKNVVNEILKRNKTNYVANKAKEGEDEDEEYECPE